MPIVADIADLAAAEFLLMLSMNRKSGKLSGTCEDRRVMVALREGSIVYAGSTSVREKVGSILVSRRLVTEEELQRAIEQQQRERGVKHLGTILVDMGLLTQEALEEVVRSQFQRVIEELLSWPDGVMTFHRMSIPDLGAVHVDPREILVDVGFETEMLVLGSISNLEDDQFEAAISASVSTLGAGPPQRTVIRQAQPHPGMSAERPAPAPSPAPAPEEAQQVVRSLMEEMHALSVSISAEATMQVLSNSLGVVRRAALLMVSPSHMHGLGGFGFDNPVQTSEEVVRNLVVMRSQPSIFTRVIGSSTTYQGPPESSPYDRHILEQLGGLVPTEVVLVPMVVGDAVVAVLYGDNAPEGQPIRDALRLEAVMAQVAGMLEDQAARRGRG